MRPFKYKKSYKMIYQHCCFDSLLELKYAISIEQEYEYLRAHIPIYYDPKTNYPTDYLKETTRKYTPDFLIRNKITHKASFVELKPRAFENNPQLDLRRAIAEKYIRWKGMDWSFAVVFDDEIKLTLLQQKKFRDLCDLKSKSAYKIQFEKMNNRYDRSQPKFFRTVPDNTLVQFVKYGSLGSLTKIAQSVIPSFPSTEG